MGQNRALRREACKSGERGSLRTRAAILTAILLACNSPASAQFSGYSSIGFGYHQNPLYNYAKLSDQMRLAYLEFSYQKDSDISSFGVRYVGSLTVFNQLQDRNYYEHSLAGLYTLHLTGTTVDSGSKEGESEDEEEAAEEKDKPPSYADSTGSYVTIGLRLAARHDKAVRQDFDNQGGELNVAYRFTTGEQSFGRLLNTFTSRSYPSVAELSNVNDIVSANFSVWSDGGMVYGASASFGVKYYSTSIFDTTRFQSTVGTSSGKGKPGGQPNGTTTQEILLEPQINGTIQLSATLFLRKNWSAQSSLSAVALYRLTPRYAERYLAPLTPEASLTEDLYVDFFSYKGPEVQIRLTQPLFANIQSILGYEFHYKGFGIPALDLEGNEIEPTRTDKHNTVELFLSRYFDFSGGLGLDVSFGVEIARNQSNDRYNDFSTYSVSLGFGVGF
jgi:hypothetical protein